MIHGHPAMDPRGAEDRSLQHPWVPEIDSRWAFAAKSFARRWMGPGQVRRALASRESGRRMARSGTRGQAVDPNDLPGRTDSTPPDHFPSYLRKEPSNWVFMAAGASSIALFCCAMASAFLPLSNSARA